MVKGLRQKNRAIADKIKLTTKCKCGETWIDRLVFHHRDDSTKKNEVSHMYGQPTEEMMAEIAKCDVLCYGCHNALHGKEKSEKQKLMRKMMKYRKCFQL